MKNTHRYITVLDFVKGQVYVHDYNGTNEDAEAFVDNLHDLANVEYMVHKYTPALWTRDLYFCSREEAMAITKTKL